MSDRALKPYLRWSAAAHGALAVGIGLAGVNGARPPQRVYTIDFVGATSGILNRERPSPGKETPAVPAAPAAPPTRPPPQTDPDAFPRKPSRPLPKPSFLASPRPEAAPAPAAAEKGAALGDPIEAPRAAGEQGAPAGGSAEVAPDMPDFPYPWFITQVRAALWERWSERMPGGGSECGVVFSILRDGSVVDLRVELSSGDKGTDYAAVSAVRDAAPFPPLPPGFREPFLRVHVAFKSRG